MSDRPTPGHGQGLVYERATARRGTASRLRDAVRSFGRWDRALVPDRPRDAPRWARVLLGGRDIIARRSMYYEWSWWLHPLRRLAYNRVKRDRHAAWEAMWGGDPITRRIALKEDTLTACGRALLNPDPRIHGVIHELQAEIVLRQEHGKGREGWSVRDYTEEDTTA